MCILFNKAYSTEHCEPPDSLLIFAGRYNFMHVNSKANHVSLSFYLKEYFTIYMSLSEINTAGFFSCLYDEEVRCFRMNYYIFKQPCPTIQIYVLYMLKEYD